MKRGVRVGDLPVETPPTPRKRNLWPLSGLFLGLSLAVAGWLVHEVGLLRFTPVAAQDGKGADALETLRQSIQSRESALEEREQALKRQEAALGDRERILQEQIKSYQKTIDELRAKLAAAERDNPETDRSILAIYEKMEPKRAALIFEKLDTHLAVRLLGAMAPNRAAEILGLMSSDRARLLTERHLASLKNPSPHK